MRHAIIYVQKCRMGDILLGQEERMRLARMTRVWEEDASDLRRRTRLNTLRSRAISLLGVGLCRACRLGFRKIS